MAPCATPNRKRFNRPPIVVAPHTKSSDVSPFQPVSGFFLMVKMKIFLDDIPTVWNMAKAAILWEGFMRNKRA
jgi:hypothetical protein